MVTKYAADLQMHPTTRVNSHPFLPNSSLWNQHNYLLPSMTPPIATWVARMAAVVCYNMELMRGMVQQL